jgi:hypothetical protein
MRGSLIKIKVMGNVFLIITPLQNEGEYGYDRHVRFKSTVVTPLFK